MAATAKQRPAGSLAKLSIDLLLLGSQIVKGGSQAHSYDELHQRVHSGLDALAREAAGQGFTAADIEDTRYALAAYLDEMVQFSSWPGKQQWATRPLQVELFGEQLAGVKFFERLQQVGARSKEVLEVYYLCLSLGFRGRYHLGDAEELQRLIEAVRHKLIPRWQGTLAVHGTSSEVAIGAGARRFPFVALTFGLVILSLIVAGALMVLLSGAKGEAVEVLMTLGRG